MKWKTRSIRELAKIICGDTDYFRYRSSSYITEFFQDCGLDYVHDGTTRQVWVTERFKQVLALPQTGISIPSYAFIQIIRAVLDKGDAQEGDCDGEKALTVLNAVLSRKGWEAYFDEHNVAQLRHIGTNTVTEMANPHRPLTPDEIQIRDRLSIYMGTCSEDDLIEEILLPLFRQLGFHRITASGHKDKALEYGKDIWMKYSLPTLHVLYFGIQAKKGKLDSAGMSRNGSNNIGEIYNQVSMMLGHEIFDPELNRRVLVDHAFIVAGGEITKQARNWLGNKLDAAKRSQIMFMDKNDILDLFIVTKLPLPKGLISVERNTDILDEVPF
ncbi:hypothetical protein [uncultured Bartonella sp.]|uniref:hypothetical protein n=1 Tax=uncultured Bartonella sp. TaxID=104108 RepID=UPI0026094BF4|nr:hypothetical protein [uncultured Bartonella sp.]